MREPKPRRTLKEVHDEHVRRGGRPRAQARGGEPGSTRERILDIALDLFTEQGYDKTSLREIAEELGFTKAALYYHFERKEDLLLALHLRLHALGSDALSRLTAARAGEDPLGWLAVLDDFLDQVLANRKLFLFHTRNQNALGKLEHDHQNDAEHADFEERLHQVLGDTSYPLSLRVRMACSIGAVMGTLMGVGEAFADVASDELAALVREAVRDLMLPAASRGSTPVRS